MESKVNQRIAERWVASQYLDDNRWGVLSESNHIIFGVSAKFTKEQAELIVKQHNSEREG